jgi:hypothetical protein
MEEVEFWQGIKTIQKMKRRCPTLLDEETEQFSLHSLPHKMATCAPLAYIIPNDVEGQ